LGRILPAAEQADHILPPALVRAWVSRDITVPLKELVMHLVRVLLVAFLTIELSACAVLGAAGSVAGAAGSLVVTTAKAAGDVIGAGARTVTGSSDDDSK
jgi:hypothetical protein